MVALAEMSAVEFRYLIIYLFVYFTEYKAIYNWFNKGTRGIDINVMLLQNPFFLFLCLFQ